MSVIVPIEMPKSCYSEDEFCPFHTFVFDLNGGKNICTQLGKKASRNKRLADCPLVELPPHGNLKDDNALIDAIIEQNGIQAQTIQLGEEMGELFIAVSHRLRNRTLTNEHIKEEIADVTFMLQQLIHFFDIDEQEIKEVIEQKKQRMRERLKKI